MHLIQLLASPAISTFSAATAGCDKTFFGLVPWYHYLSLTAAPACSVNADKFQVLGANSSLLLILLAVIDNLLRIAGMVAVGYIIYGGFRYTTSQGSPDQTAAAQKTIINAVIGLVIALISVALVSFIGRRLG